MKTNIKHYSEKTIKSLFEQLRSSISGKHNGLQNIVDVCENIVLNADDTTQYWFVNIFSKIIQETGQYYGVLPFEIRPYYRQFFIEKLNSKFFKHLENNITDKNVLTHFKCLYWAYIKCNIYENHLNHLARILVKQLQTVL